MASLTDATAFVEDFCERQAVGHADTMRLLLVIEELFTNTVQHGHRGDCEAPIGVALQVNAAAVELHYEDSAPAFDSLAATAPADLDAPEAERAPGGLGLHLVKRFAASARYAREHGLNRLWIVLPRLP